MRLHSRCYGNLSTLCPIPSARQAGRRLLLPCAMSTKKVKEATSVVDNYHEVHLPLDFSFKALSKFPGILREKPRTRQAKAVLVLEDELSAEGSTDTIEVEKSCSRALRVNNNMLGDWEDFLPTVFKILVEPATRLAWIDFSFNDLRTIDNALLQLPTLTMLYFHGNNIDQISEVDKLSALTKLKSLTLHGNPIEITPGYRHYVLSQVAQLQTFDFGGITKADRATAKTWQTMITPKTRTRKHSSTTKGE